MPRSSLAPLVPLLVLIASSAWVLQDARMHERDRRPVVVTIFGLTLEEPSTWAALCLVLFVVVFPMYLVARRASS
jgi:hypothetical protein